MGKGSDVWDPLAEDDLPQSPKQRQPASGPPKRSDAAWNIDSLDEDDDDLELLPVDEEVAENRRRVFASELPPQEPEEEPEASGPTFRFSLRHLLGGVTAAAVVLGLSRNLGGDLLAGGLGLLVLLAMIALSVAEHDDPAAKKAWWALLGVYLFSCLVAALSGW